MQDDTLKALFHAMKVQRSDTNFLYKLVFLQRAQIEALTEFSVKKISKLDKKDQSAVRKELGDLTRLAYDRIISHLEELQPATASEVDVRDALSEDQEAFWRLVSEEFPKKDEEPPAESED
jgi:hypothetical protein